MAAYPLTGEGWTWFAVVMTLVITRYASRWIQLRSLKAFRAEDYVMAFVAMLYTAEIYLLIIMSGTPTNLMKPGEYDPTNLPDIQRRIYGSKVIVALEMVYDAGIWGCKVCLLLYYSNMMYSLPSSYTWIKLCASYVIMGYVVMVCLYFGVWCQPFYDYWAVPAENPQCSTAENHLILNCVLNISSDLMMMMIPLPLLIRTRLPRRDKILVCCLFSCGAFVVLSATLNKYYSFTNPYGSDWVYWYTREISMAVIVTNLPHIWVLFRKVFRLQTYMSNRGVAETGSASLGSSMRKPLSTRIYESDDNARSPRPPQRNLSASSAEIDRIMAEADRERAPMQPVRFRDLRQTPSFEIDLEDGKSASPESPTRSHKIPAPLPLSPIGGHHDVRNLLQTPSPTALRTPRSARSMSSLRSV